MYKHNIRRTYRYPVAVVTIAEDGKEHIGHFKAIFRNLLQSEMENPENREKRLLDMALLGVEDIEIPGPDGQPLQGDDLLRAVKDDNALATALVLAYRESETKKAPTGS